MLSVSRLFNAWCFVVRCISVNKTPTFFLPSICPTQGRSSHPSLLAPCRKHQKHIALILLSSYFSMPGVLLAQGITVANTGRAPSLDTAANGVPIVNINAPSAKGVSRNEYEQLNVDAKGLIFNNATAIVKTKLAGYVDGNKRLGGKSAGIILNEVVGNSRSALNGYMEIAGQRAQLVIANQSGITCNGCGFINTSRGILTTGSSVFDAFGNLSGFDVSKGDVDITGLGFNDTDTDEVDILARSVSLNAKMWANQATVITGDNLINYQDKAVTSRSSTGDKAGFSLDVAAIGGMYANRIHLIGTEKGLGVNLAGEIKAAADMTLDSQGNLVNKGHLSGQQVKVAAQSIDNTGEVLGDSMTLAATDLNNTGSRANIQATKTLNMDLQGQLNNQDGAKIQTPDGQLTINANTIINQSTIAANQLSISAVQLNNQTESGTIYGTDTVDLTLTGQLHNSASALIQSDNQLTINANEDIVNSATLASIGSATINAQNLINSGKVQTQNGQLALEATQEVDNQGLLQGHGITLTADQLSNHTANAKIYSSDKLVATLSGAMANAINNRDGALIHADQALTLSSENSNINNALGSTIKSATEASLTSHNLTNNGTILAQGDTLTIRTQQLDNERLLGGKNIDINVSVLNNNTSTSQIYADNDVDITTTAGAIINSNGALIHAGNQLTLTAAGELINTSATIESATNASLTSYNLSNATDATILAQNGTLTIKSGILDEEGNLDIHTGTLDEDGQLIFSTGRLDNAGTISGTNINATASVVNNNKSTSNLAATNDLTLKTIQGNVNNQNGAHIRANNSLTINAAADLVNTGSFIESANNMALSSRHLTNSGNALIRANDSITLDWRGALSNNNANIEAQNNIQTTPSTEEDGENPRSGSLTNTRSGLITAQNGTLGLTLGSLSNQGSIGADRVELDTSGVSNSGGSGLIMAKSYLDVRSTGKIDNLDGGSLFSLGGGYLQAKGTITNSSAEIETRGGDLTIKANRLINKRSFVEIGSKSVSNEAIAKL